jgi:hypothetical protein
MLSRRGYFLDARDELFFKGGGDVTVRPDTAETLTSRGMALVFEVVDICDISYALVFSPYLLS